ncbi:hypothetical protein [Lactococcus cremoris]|uniref:hypothetical protein n=1 Tax=Lactococcus lactis subsp. cremoris TaxID=1359 RepID=UPI001F299104|nr:hypothetical protein [Lactococcus cremoris]
MVGLSQPSLAVGGSIIASTLLLHRVDSIRIAFLCVHSESGLNQCLQSLKTLVEDFPNCY